MEEAEADRDGNRQHKRKSQASVAATEEHVAHCYDAIVAHFKGHAPPKETFDVQGKQCVRIRPPLRVHRVAWVRYVPQDVLRTRANLYSSAAAVPMLLPCVRMSYSPLFVTWKKYDHRKNLTLRGCIGNLSPIPLTKIKEYALTRCETRAAGTPSGASLLSCWGVTRYMSLASCSPVPYAIVGSHPWTRASFHTRTAACPCWSTTKRADLGRISRCVPSSLLRVNAGYSRSVHLHASDRQARHDHRVRV